MLSIWTCLKFCCLGKRKPGPSATLLQNFCSNLLECIPSDQVVLGSVYSLGSVTACYILYKLWNHKGLHQDV